MAIQANEMSTLQGFFKNTYADKLQNLIPEDARLQQLIKFLPKDRQPGLKYNQPKH